MGRVGDLGEGLVEIWTDLATAALAAGRETEAALYAALATGDADPTDPAAVAGSVDVLDPERRARVLVEVAGAWRLVERPDVAEPFLLDALAAAPGDLDAQLGLAAVRMPGPGYYELLDRLHDVVRPRTYLEIGMGDGSSMALARPGTRCVGVDPVPRLCTPVVAECRVFPEPSEAFFARPDLAEIFAAGRPDLVFIDGLHTFPAVLADLIGTERLSRPDTIVVLHDTLPLDEPTQRPDRAHAFYTGDVWKLLPCLAAARPDLDVFTVRTAPSGLTFVTGLQPTSTVLAARYDELVAEFGSLPYVPTTAPLGDVAADDWSTVVSWLGRSG